MTVSTTIAVSGPYTGNGATTAFDYDFKIYNDTHLQVILTVIATGAETTLELDTDYSVSGVGEDAGGTITYPISGSPMASTHKLTIKRAVPKTQGSDYTNTGGYVGANHERSYDLLQMQIQDVQEEVDRSVKVDVSSSTDPDDLIDTLTADAAAAASSAAAAAASASAASDDADDAAASEVAAAASAAEAAAAVGGVKVSADDTTPSNLEAKLLVSGPLSLSTQNGGANETRTITANVADQSEAEAGTASDKLMTPQRVAQAIAALTTSEDAVARDMAASALAYSLAANDASSITGSVGKFYLVDDFETDSLAVSTNATYDATGDYYSNPGGGTTSASSGAYTTGAASVSWTGDDLDITGGDDAIYLTSTFDSGDWPMQYGYTLADTADNANACSGLFDSAEVGTFNHTTSSAGGLDSMTKSWHLRHSDGTCFYGGVSQGTLSGGGVVNTDDVEWNVAADGTVTIKVNASTEFTFTQKANGISIHFMHASSNASRTMADIYWTVSGTPANMTLEPSDATLDTANPTDLIGYFVINPGTADFDTNGDAAAGDDIVGKASIDSGVTWATGTWTKVGDIGSSGEELWKLEADVSGQTGTALTYQITTQNTEVVELHDCVGVVAIY